MANRRQSETHRRANRRESASAAEYRRAARLREALRHFHRQSEQITRAHGLTPQRYELLLMIKTAVNGQEGAPLAELADRLKLAQSTTTELVHRAEDAGLVRRELDSAKRGAMQLRLTKEGERRLTAAFRDLRAERRRLTSLLSALEDDAATSA
jgi:DNA-binding MarR family transcriptional regulator